MQIARMDSMFGDDRCEYTLYLLRGIQVTVKRLCLYANRFRHLDAPAIARHLR
jgi:hypothetical protein